jgi:hypothetical protein
VEEWEELLHPGSLARMYPTSSHNATLFAHSLPQPHPNAGPEGEIAGANGLFVADPARRAGARSLHERLQDAEMGDGLQTARLRAGSA